MNDILKAIQKHEVEIANHAIDKLVEEIKTVLGDTDADLLESLDEHLGEIIKSAKEAILEELKKSSKVAIGKKVKDPNAPKRLPSEYNLFVKEYMAKLKDRDDVPPKDRMKMAVAAWKQHKAMKAGHTEDAHKSDSDSDHHSDEEVDVEDVDVKKKKKKEAPKKEEAPKKKK